MSFAVHNKKPPFIEAVLVNGKWTGEGLNPGEKIYQVGSVWVVTDQGQPTQQQIDAVLNPPPGPPSLQDQLDSLRTALEAKSVVTSADIQAATESLAATPMLKASDATPA